MAKDRKRRMSIRDSIAYLKVALFWQSPAHGDILERERGQALVRVALSAVAAACYYVYAFLTGNSPSAIPTWMFCLGYAVISVAFFWYLLHTSISPAWRRYTANLADMAGLSLTMIIARESGTPVFLFYLWITLGNGFRFGVPALTVSAILSIVGFSSVIGLTEVWRNNPALAVGVFLALTIIPFQAARYILQHERNWASVSEQNSKTKRPVD